MGLGTWISVFTVAPAFALASKLAVETGAWSFAPQVGGAHDVSSAPKVIQITHAFPPAGGLVE